MKQLFRWQKLRRLEQRQCCSDAFNNVKVVLLLCLLVIWKYMSRKSRCFTVQGATIIVQSSGLLMQQAGHYFPTELNSWLKVQSRPFNSLNISHSASQKCAEYPWKVCVKNVSKRSFSSSHAGSNTACFHLHTSQERSFFKYIDEVRKDIWWGKAPWKRP